MELPIPNDWDGETWRCVRIEFPDSVQWIAHLHGALSLYMRGRYWSAGSGSILEAQAVGKDIWQRNTPLISCDGTPDAPSEGAAGDWIAYLGSMIFEEDDCMNGCCIRWNNGVLELLNCGVWQPVPTLGASGLIAPEEVVVPGNANDIWDWGENEPAEGTNPFSACAKAEALTNTIFDVAQVCYGASDDLIPYNAVRDAEDAAKMNLDNKWLYSAIGWALQMRLAAIPGIEYDEEEIFSDTSYRRMKCLLLGLLYDDGAGITRDAFNSFRAQWTGYQGLDFLRSDFWGAVLLAIGPNDAATITASAARSTPEDCDDCIEGGPPLPEELEIGPVTGGWYLGEAIIVRAPFGSGAPSMFPQSVPQHDVYGMAWLWYDAVGGVVERVGRGVMADGTYGIDVSMTTAGVSDVTYDYRVGYQMAQSIADDLGLLFHPELEVYRYSTNKQSSVVETPVSAGGVDTVGGSFGWAVTSGSGLATLEVRFLHNTGSPSHA